MTSDAGAESDGRDVADGSEGRIAGRGASRIDGLVLVEGLVDVLVAVLAVAGRAVQRKHLYRYSLWLADLRRYLQRYRVLHLHQMYRLQVQSTKLLPAGVIRSNVYLLFCSSYFKLLLFI